MDVFSSLRKPAPAGDPAGAVPFIGLLSLALFNIPSILKIFTATIIRKDGSIFVDGFPP
jgi:hypothetical protein